MHLLSRFAARAAILGTRIFGATVLLPLALGPATAWAGTAPDSPATGSLRGRVVERGTRTPIPDAQVFLADDEEAPPADTGADGSFELPVPGPGRYRIGAAALGFEHPNPVVVEWPPGSPPDAVTLYLEATANAEPIVVRAERNPDRVAKRVLSGDELSQVPGSAGDPVRALQSLPGVAVANDVGGAPAIRGTRPGDNLFYIDFLPAPYLFHANGTVSVVPGDLVDSFNLYPGAFGPEYGDVIGAVVDVALRPPRKDRLGATADLSLLGSALILEGPVTENQSFLLAARRSYLDLVVGRIEDEEEGVDFEVPEYHDYQGMYLWEPGPGDGVKVEISGAGDRTGFRLDEGSDEARKEPVLAGRSRNETDFHRQGVTWDRRLAGGAANRLALGHDRITEDATIGRAADQSLAFDTFRVREQLQWPLGERHDLTAGAEYDRMRVDLDLDAQAPRCTEFDPECDLTGADRVRLQDRFTVNGWAVYAKDRIQLAPRLHAVAGLRYSGEDYLDSAFLEPRLGLEWDADDQTLFTLGWGRHHQFPSGEQVVEGFGNPDLRPIRSEHCGLGVTRRLGFEWVVDLQTYYKTFDDFAIADSERNYVNEASGRAYGTELLVRKLPTGRLSGWLAVTASRSRRENDRTGEEFPFDYDQPLIATLVGTYQISRRWSVGLKWWYHSGAPYTPVVGTGTYPDGRTRPLYGDLNSERLPAYHRLDLRVDRHFVLDRWKLDLYLEVINAYNRRNVSGYTYDPSYTDRDPVYQLPLIPSVGIKAEF